MIMTVFIGKKFWLIPVPAVAVIREERAVFVMIERKGLVDGFFFKFKSLKFNF